MQNRLSGFVSDSIVHNIKCDEDLNFIYNSPENEQKVITTVSKNLESCDSFDFSVAFISMSGVTALLQELRRFNTGNKRGRILTTDYLNFNDPVALRKLLEFEDIDVRVYTKENFHTKAYMFTKNGNTTALIGSSNLTAGALCQNKEWNLLVSPDETSLLTEIYNEFESMWGEADYLTEEWIIDYIPRFEKSKKHHDEEKIELESDKAPKPN